MDRPTSQMLAPIAAAESLAATKALDRLVSSAKTLARAARSPATLRAYATDLRLFSAWCEKHAVDAFPASPQTVALYAAALFEQGRAVATIRGRLVAIGLEHKRRKLPVPTSDEMVREVLKGISRTLGTKQAKKKPLYADDVKALLTALPDTPRGWRDRALILLGYSGAFRRAELASLQVEWITRVVGGLEITLPTSKVDQAGAGTMIIIEAGSDPATCPIAVLQRYMQEARISNGAMFRKIDRHGNIGAYALEGKAVASIVQSRVKHLLSYDATGYGAHSLSLSRFPGHRFALGESSSSRRVHGNEASHLRR